MVLSLHLGVRGQAAPLGSCPPHASSSVVSSPCSLEILRGPCSHSVPRCGSVSLLVLEWVYVSKSELCSSSAISYLFLISLFPLWKGFTKLLLNVKEQGLNGRSHPARRLPSWHRWIGRRQEHEREKRPCLLWSFRRISEKLSCKQYRSVTWLKVLCNDQNSVLFEEICL